MATYTVDENGVLTHVSIDVGETEVVIPESLGVLQIGTYAFGPEITSRRVVLPNTCQRIQPLAFFNNFYIERLEIGSGLSFIASHAFAYNNPLKEVVVSESNSRYAVGNGGVYSKDKKHLRLGINQSQIAVEEGCYSIGNYAFAGCRGVELVTLPTSKIAIGDYSFSDCISLQNIVITPNVYWVGEGAFFGCERMISLVIEEADGGESDAGEGESEQDGLVLPRLSFANCKGLKNVVLVARVKEIEDKIGEAAFDNDYGIEKCFIPQGYEPEKGSLPPSREYPTDGHKILVRFNGGGAVVEPSSKYVYYGAPYGELPTPDAYEGHTFKGWFKGSEEITPDIFCWETASEITLTAAWDLIPYTVTFYRSNGQVYEQYVELYGTVLRVPTAPSPSHPDEEGAFKYWQERSTGERVNADGTITVSRDAEYAPVYYSNQIFKVSIVNGGARINGINEDAPLDEIPEVIELPIAIIYRGNVYDVVALGNGAFQSDQRVHGIVISEDSHIRSIPSNCFRGCSNLEKVDILAPITDIGAAAFMDCPKLGERTEVYIGTYSRTVRINVSLKTIGGNAFRNAGLDVINWIPGEDNPDLDSIGARAFYLSSITGFFCNTVGEVGVSAFESCASLTTFGFGAKVIRDRAFRNCTALSYSEVANHFAFSTDECQLKDMGVSVFDGCPEEIFAHDVGFPGIAEGIWRVNGWIVKADQRKIPQTLDFGELWDSWTDSGGEYNQFGVARNMFAGANITSFVFPKYGMVRVCQGAFSNISNNITLTFPQGNSPHPDNPYTMEGKSFVSFAENAITNIYTTNNIGDRFTALRIECGHRWESNEFEGPINLIDSPESGTVYIGFYIYALDSQPYDFTISTNVNAYAFMWCRRIPRTVHISDGCTQIGAHAFEESWGDYDYVSNPNEDYCVEINQSFDGQNLVRIGERAWYNSRLSMFGNVDGSSYIPGHIVEIEKEAFANCTLLSGIRFGYDSMTLEYHPPLVSYDAFSGTNISTTTIGSPGNEMYVLGEQMIVGGNVGKTDGIISLTNNFLVDWDAGSSSYAIMRFWGHNVFAEGAVGGIDTTGGLDHTNQISITFRYVDDQPETFDVSEFLNIPTLVGVYFEPLWTLNEDFTEWRYLDRVEVDWSRVKPNPWFTISLNNCDEIAGWQDRIYDSPDTWNFGERIDDGGIVRKVECDVFLSGTVYNSNEEVAYNNLQAAIYRWAAAKQIIAEEGSVFYQDKFFSEYGNPLRHGHNLCYVGDENVAGGIISNLLIKGYGDPSLEQTDPNLQYHALRRVSARAFDGCGSLQSVTIDDEVVQMGEDVFRDNNLAIFTQTNYPGLLVVDGWIVGLSESEGGYNISTVDFNEIGVTIRGVCDYAFRHARHMVALSNVPEGIKASTDSWENTDRASLAMPREYGARAAKKVVDNRFDSYRGKEQVSITAGEGDIIPSEAFKGDEALREIEVTDNSIAIGDAAFEDCISLQRVEIPYGATGIGEAAFRNCRLLESTPRIIGPIGNYAFENCIGLKRVYIESLRDAPLLQDVFLGAEGIEDLTIPCHTHSEMVEEDSRANAPWDISGIFGGKVSQISFAPGQSHVLALFDIDKMTNKLKGISIPRGISSVAFFTVDGKPIRQALDENYAEAHYEVSNGGSKPLVICGWLMSLECQGDAPIRIDDAIGVASGCIAEVSGISSITFSASLKHLSPFALASCPNLRRVEFEGETPSVEPDGYQAIDEQGAMDSIFNGSPNVEVYVRRGSIGWGVNPMEMGSSPQGGPTWCGRPIFFSN